MILSMLYILWMWFISPGFSTSETASGSSMNPDWKEKAASSTGEWNASVLFYMSSEMILVHIKKNIQLRYMVEYITYFGIEML